MWPFDRGRTGSSPVFTQRLARALPRPGCPICRLVREGEERWAWTLLYEFTGDPEIHELFASSLGLCAQHARLLERVVEEKRLMTPSGVARLYETVVRRLAGSLAGSPTRLSLKRGDCPLCTYAAEAADRESYFLARLLRLPEWREKFAASDGLCLPHLQTTLRHCDREVRGWLLADFERRLAELAANLRELQRKQRYDVHEPLSSEEAGAWREALWRLGGMSYDRLLVDGL